MDLILAHEIRGRSELERRRVAPFSYPSDRPPTLSMADNFNRSEIVRSTKEVAGFGTDSGGCLRWFFISGGAVLDRIR